MRFPGSPSARSGFAANGERPSGALPYREVFGARDDELPRHPVADDVGGNEGETNEQEKQ